MYLQISNTVLMNQATDLPLASLFTFIEKACVVIYQHYHIFLDLLVTLSVALKQILDRNSVNILSKECYPR